MYNLTTVYNTAVQAVSCLQTVTQAGGKLMQECRKHVLVNEISQRNVMRVGRLHQESSQKKTLEFEIHVLVVGRRGEGQRRE